MFTVGERDPVTWPIGCVNILSHFQFEELPRNRLKLSEYYGLLLRLPNSLLT